MVGLSLDRHLDVPQGVLRHGFSRWKPLLDDASLDLQSQLRVELGAKKPGRALGTEKTLAEAAAARANGGASGSDAPGQQAAPSPVDSGDGSAAGSAGAGASPAPGEVSACGSILRDFAYQKPVCCGAHRAPRQVACACGCRSRGAHIKPCRAVECPACRACRCADQPAVIMTRPVVKPCMPLHLCACCDIGGPDAPLRLQSLAQLTIDDRFQAYCIIVDVSIVVCRVRMRRPRRGRRRRITAASAIGWRDASWRCPMCCTS